jgi:release factor glutamine methyltransferase
MIAHMARDSHSTSSAAPSDVWTTRRLLEWMGGYLAERGVEDARLTAELLLAHVLDCERLRLFMDVDRPASTEELSRLRPMVKRVVGHEPVQYVLGEGWFYGGSFEVNRSTLIPRPCTETLVEHVIWHVRRFLRGRGETPVWDEVSPALRGTGVPPVALHPPILDIGTGTGCIAVTLAKEMPQARIVATDISEEILALAQRNALKHEVAARIDFRIGSLFEPVGSDERFDIICSNPPYVPDHEWPDVPRNVKEYEPETALRGGVDGLDLVRPLIAQSIQHLSPGGLLAVEIASVQKDEVLHLAREAGFTSAEGVKDHEQKTRVLLARK